MKEMWLLRRHERKVLIETVAMIGWKSHWYCRNHKRWTKIHMYGVVNIPECYSWISSSPTSSFISSYGQLMWSRKQLSWRIRFWIGDFLNGKLARYRRNLDLGANDEGVGIVQWKQPTMYEAKQWLGLGLFQRRWCPWPTTWQRTAVWKLSRAIHSSILFERLTKGLSTQDCIKSCDNKLSGLYIKRGRVECSWRSSASGWLDLYDSIDYEKGPAHICISPIHRPATPTSAVEDKYVLMACILPCRCKSES